jgi:predicted esterase
LQAPLPHSRRACVRAQESAAIRPGQHDLKLGDADRDGVIYIPRGYTPEKAWPLMVMLHGAGQHRTRRRHTLSPRRRIRRRRPGARLARRGDVGRAAYRIRPGRRIHRRGAEATYRLCQIDRKRMALAGHSDGASYSLSLGLGTGETFGHVIAFSPGVMKPAEVHGKPHIFISHGLSDPIMPIDVTSRRFVRASRTWAMT